PGGLQPDGAAGLSDRHVYQPTSERRHDLSDSGNARTGDTGSVPERPERIIVLHGLEPGRIFGQLGHRQPRNQRRPPPQTAELANGRNDFVLLGMEPGAGAARAAKKKTGAAGRRTGRFAGSDSDPER